MRLTIVIVSDGVKPFETDKRPTESGSAVLLASTNILMEQVRGLQFSRRELDSDRFKPIWFSIDSEEGQASEGDAALASAIRTNLKKLSHAELAVLTRHSGALLAHRLQTYAPELVSYD